EDSDSLMEEIDLFFNLDDPMPPGIEDDDDDSERDILILEELLNNYSLSLPTNESYHFDIPSPYRPPAKPPDGITGTLNIKMRGDVSDQKVSIPNLTIILKAQSWKLPVCYDDDDDEEGYNSLNDDIIFELPSYSTVIPTEPIDSLKSMPNYDSSIIISSKIDYLFDEFAGELTLLKSFPPGIDETDCHPEKEIRLTKRL
nr:hypothetical protein [Tanacetum cinerariifolium]